MLYIILIGLLLRLNCINKPEGLWNDEYVSWFVASTSSGFWQEVFKQCHMPLYYLYLKPFAGYSDIVLRLTSVIPGVISIWVMYLAGREYSKKIGYFAALITSVLSFLIYYSQEVRFYSLLFLFSALALLFTIRVIKETNKFNIAGYALASFLIIFTHILGIIYVFCSFVYVICVKKKFSAWFLFPFVLVLPFVPHFLRMLPSSQWWGHFSYTNLLFLLTDYFSPILTNNINAPPVFFYNKELAPWLVIPVLTIIPPLIAGIKRGLAAVAFGTVLILSLLAVSGELVFITKYSMEILPILILFVSTGFDRLKKIGAVLFAFFILIHIAAVFTPHYVTKIQRVEGHGIVGQILNRQNPDNIIFTYYEPDRFLRYTDTDGKNLYYISKINRFEYLDNPSEILDNVPLGETVSVVFLDSVSFFDDLTLEANRSNRNIPEMFLTFSAVKNSLIKALDAYFCEYDVVKSGAWTVIKAKRCKE